MAADLCVVTSPSIHAFNLKFYFLCISNVKKKKKIKTVFPIYFEYNDGWFELDGSCLTWKSNK